MRPTSKNSKISRIPLRIFSWEASNSCLFQLHCVLYNVHIAQSTIDISSCSSLFQMLFWQLPWWPRNTWLVQRRKKNVIVTHLDNLFFCDFWGSKRTWTPSYMTCKDIRDPRYVSQHVPSYYSSSQTCNHIVCKKVPQAGLRSMTQLWRLFQEKLSWLVLSDNEFSSTKCEECCWSSFFHFSPLLSHRCHSRGLFQAFSDWD